MGRKILRSCVVEELQRGHYEHRNSDDRIFIAGWNQSSLAATLTLQFSPLTLLTGD
jgi:hypothetical protein